MHSSVQHLETIIRPNCNYFGVVPHKKMVRRLLHWISRELQTLRQLCTERHYRPTAVLIMWLGQGWHILSLWAGHTSLSWALQLLLFSPVIPCDALNLSKFRASHGFDRIIATTLLRCDQNGVHIVEIYALVLMSCMTSLATYNSKQHMAKLKLLIRKQRIFTTEKTWFHILFAQLAENVMTLSGG